MKEKTFYEALLNYCEKTLQYDYMDEKTKREWIFGAIDFARSEDFINAEQFEEVLNKHDLI